jgi:hypothetical protein
MLSFKREKTMKIHALKGRPQLRDLHLLFTLGLCAMLSTPVAHAAGEPLSATLNIHGGGRSGAPRGATVEMIWNGQGLLEGDLLIELMDGREVLSRSVVRDMALPTGAQSLGITLPAASVYGSGLTTKARLKFRTPTRTIDLGEHACSIPTFTDRLLSILYPLPLVGEAETRQTAAALRPDWLNPEKAKPGRSSFRSGVCALPPDAFPGTPEGYCAHDMVVLTGAGATKLRTSQLKAMLTWCRAGGTLVLANPERMPATHQALFTELFRHETGQSALSFDHEGNPVETGIVLKHVALGRAVLVLAPDLGERELREDPAWRRVIAFAWKLRAGQLTSVVSSSAWNAEDENEATTGGRGNNGSYRYLMRKHTQQLALQPINFAASYDYMTTIMPRDIRFINLGQLALVLFLLVLFIGPVDYFLLRRLKLQRFTWLTVPLYVTLATMGIIAMANHAMGRHDRRGRLCMLDTDATGQPVRQSDVHLIIPARHGLFKEHVQRALVSSVPIAVNHYNGGPTDSDSAKREIAGRYPTDFQMRIPVSQWKPKAWRTLTLRPKEVFPWKLPDTQDLWSKKSVNAFWKEFQALNDKLPSGAYVLQNGSMETLKNDAWPSPQGLGEQTPRRLAQLAEAPRIGYFSVVSAISPSGDASMEDILIYDRTNPDQAVLVLAWRDKDGTVITSRTPYHRTQSQTLRLSENDQHAGTPTGHTNEEG